MPNFGTVKGEFTHVFAAQNHPAIIRTASFSTNPERRICPMFDDLKEQCPHNPCLLGHQGGAQGVSGIQAVCTVQAAHGVEAQQHHGDSRGHRSRSEQRRELIDDSNPQPDLKPTALKMPPNPNPNPPTSQPSPKPQPMVQDSKNSVNPVNFEVLAEENNRMGRRYEIESLCQSTESLEMTSMRSKGE